MTTTPNLITEPRLHPILEELRAREPLFHRPELGTSAADFDAQMAVDFMEVGASGRRYDRAFVLAMLIERWSKPHPDLWETSEFHCREVGPHTYVVTYTLKQGARVTRRLTIWRKHEAQWQALFHQGTLVTA